MKHADIKMGYSCNNNCIHCVVADQKESALKLRGNYDRSTEEYKNELYNSRIDGFDVVVFTGGEPTIRKDIKELLDYAKNLRFIINMQTNGRMFFYEKFAKKLSKLDIIYTVALHGDDDGLHDSITRAKGSFVQTIKGIKNLISLNQTVHGKVVISKKNYKKLKEILELFIDLGINHVNMTFPHGDGNARKYFFDVVPKYSEIRYSVEKVINFVEKYNKENYKHLYVDFEAIPFCFLNGNHEYVSELNFIDEENSELKQLNIYSKNWEILRKKNKKKFLKCNLCKMDSVCEGPWCEYSKYYGESEFKPII